MTIRENQQGKALNTSERNVFIENCMNVSISSGWIEYCMQKTH